ncbi:MAG: glycoside hydrolase family 15 protein [Thermoleophilia bacterium]
MRETDAEVNSRAGTRNGQDSASGDRVEREVFSSKMDETPYRAIDDYGFLSNCGSSALVSRAGSIDWACLGRFDTGSTFARLLDHEHGGHFSIRPRGDVATVEREYLDESLVLSTTMRGPTGVIRCTDALVFPEHLHDPSTTLVRRVLCTEGTVPVEVEVVPRFDYGQTRPWLRRHNGCHSAVGGDDSIAVHASMDMESDHDATAIAGTTVLHAGQAVEFVLVYRPAHLFDPSQADARQVESLIQETLAKWRSWSRSTDVSGPHEALVRRSALVLKGCTCTATGAVIAAPTTSLPEVPGGDANWDYRYSWIRDSHVIIEALVEVGHFDEAEEFRDFVIRSSAGHADELQVMFGVYGERHLPEWTVDLEGWRGAAPVRIGNGAASQTQLDMYGHLVECAVIWQQHGRPIDDDEWRFLREVVDRAVERRHEPDAGIWELRGAPRHYVHSKVMLWVAIDRGIGLVEESGFHSDSLDAWRDAREEVRQSIETNGVDPERGNFVQHYDTDEVDASLLKLPLVGFVDANDERMLATTQAIVDRLAVAPDGFLRRFDRGDDPNEGVFLLCSFWLVEVLALQGRGDEARALFDRLTRTANDLGLFAEEWSPGARAMLGNFPQAFTHLGAIAAHTRLCRASP